MNIPADKGFAGNVAVAILGCAVVLAIAFQISQSLAHDQAIRGNEPGNRELDAAVQAVADGLPAAPVAVVASDGAVNESGGPEENLGLYGETSAEEQGEDSAAGLGAESPSSALATPSADERPMSPPRQVTPAPMREINPLEGHTIWRQAADEIGEASRMSAERKPEIARAAAPLVEMIRGNRRSSERVPGAENDDGLQ